MSDRIVAADVARSVGIMDKRLHKLYRALLRKADIPEENYTRENLPRMIAIAEEFARSRGL